MEIIDKLRRYAFLAELCCATFLNQFFPYFPQIFHNFLNFFEHFFKMWSCTEKRT